MINPVILLIIAIANIIICFYSQHQYYIQFQEKLPLAVIKYLLLKTVK